MTIRVWGYLFLVSLFWSYDLCIYPYQCHMTPRASRKFWIQVRWALQFCSLSKLFCLFQVSWIFVSILELTCQFLQKNPYHNFDLDYVVSADPLGENQYLNNNELFNPEYDVFLHSFRCYLFFLNILWFAAQKSCIHLTRCICKYFIFLMLL